MSTATAEPIVIANLDPAQEPGEVYRAVVQHEDGTLISSFGTTPDEADAAVRRHVDSYDRAAARSTAV